MWYMEYDINTLAYILLCITGIHNYQITIRLDRDFQYSASLQRVISDIQNGVERCGTVRQLVIKETM